MFTDAYARLVAMKLFALRAADYMRVASPEDRRYLLYNPMVKMKVTTQGEDVMNLLWDVIAAKGFEKDMFFEQAAVDIRALPKLEGTVHVNIALIVKFMANYFFAPGDYAEVPRQDQASNDDFLFAQGPTKGLGKIRFHRLQHRLLEPRHGEPPGLPRADRGLQEDAPRLPARRGATQGHRVPSGRWRDLCARRLRATDFGERQDLRHLRRRRGSDFRFHGAGFLATRPEPLLEALEQRDADGVPASK